MKTLNKTYNLFDVSSIKESLTAISDILYYTFVISVSTSDPRGTTNDNICIVRNLRVNINVREIIMN